jgi:xylitol oxidase
VSEAASAPTTSALTNWAGNVAFGAAKVHDPTSIDDLRRIVAGSDRIRALGGGHSFSSIADTHDDLVRLHRLPRVLRIDPEQSTVTVSAGLRYADILGELHDAGFALANLASLPHITVAGSCATATHGSGDKQRVLAASVAALCFVGPEGDLVDLRNTEADVFGGVVVNLGALGVVTELTLDIVPTFDLVQWLDVDVPLDAIAADLDAVFGSSYSASVFTDWRSGNGIVWAKCAADASEPAHVGGRRADRQLNPCPGMPPESCTEQVGVTGPWYQRLPHFRPDLTPGTGDELQSEYYVPRSAAVAAFDALRHIADVVAPALHIAEVRSVMGDELWLSPANGRDVITFHFTWRNDLAAVGPVIEAVEERLRPLGARPHWAKLTAMTPAEMIEGYEHADDFERLAREMDPAGKFRNPFLDALFPTR